VKMHPGGTESEIRGQGNEKVCGGCVGHKKMEVGLWEWSGAGGNFKGES